MLLVDTGPLLAAADRRDPAHEACSALLESHPGPLVTTALVIAEAGWLIERQLGPSAEAIFYRAVGRDEITTTDLSGPDWDRVVELIEEYADLRLGGVDASLVAIAERLDLVEIATLDRRHFTVVRPRHIDVFTLLP